MPGCTCCCCSSLPLLLVACCKLSWYCCTLAAGPTTEGAAAAAPADEGCCCCGLTAATPISCQGLSPNLGGPCCRSDAAGGCCWEPAPGKQHPSPLLSSSSSSCTVLPLLLPTLPAAGAARPRPPSGWPCCCCCPCGSCCFASGTMLPHSSTMPTTEEAGGACCSSEGPPARGPPTASLNRLLRRGPAAVSSPGTAAGPAPTAAPGASPLLCWCSLKKRVREAEVAPKLPCTATSSRSQQDSCRRTPCSNDSGRQADHGQGIRKHEQGRAGSRWAACLALSLRVAVQRPCLSHGADKLLQSCCYD